jgi:hypothetical protein
MGPLQSVKRWLVQHVALDKDALHIYFALTLFFGSAALFGWSLRNWKPWAVTLAGVLIGEGSDLRDALMHGYPIDIGHNLHDIWNALLWPSVILVLARTTRMFQH